MVFDRILDFFLTVSDVLAPSRRTVGLTVKSSVDGSRGRSLQRKSSWDIVSFVLPRNDYYSR